MPGRSAAEPCSRVPLACGYLIRGEILACVWLERQNERTDQVSTPCTVLITIIAGPQDWSLGCIGADARWSRDRATAARRAGSVGRRHCPRCRRAPAIQEGRVRDRPPLRRAEATARVAQ